MTLDPQYIRQMFPMLERKMRGKRLIYFDSAATTHKPQRVIDAISSTYEEHYGTVHRAIYELSEMATSRYHLARSYVASYLNAQVEEIIFTKGTTEGINLVASCFGKAFIRKGDEILLSILEHHSNIVPWQLMAKERGASLKFIPADAQGNLLLEEYEKLLSEKTKIVSIAHITNSIGTIHPIKEMIRKAHSYGAKVMIDGAQAAGHLPVDVTELGADFYVFSSHKVYGPTGIGVLYGKKEILSLLPPYQGGGDMIERVDLFESSYQPPPLRFEAGTPLIAEAQGLFEALSFIQDIGREKIATYETQLLEYATLELQKIDGFKIIGPKHHKGPIISFLVDGIHPLDLATFLDLEGIAIRSGHHCAQIAMRHFGCEGTARISFAIYNSLEEIDYFISTLKKVCSILV